MEYGIDVQNMLESILVDELAKSIDAQIIKDIFKVPTRIDKIKKIKDKLKQMKKNQYNNYYE
jgi:hypothetical protein